jgi:hypothetical protein
MNYQGCAQTSRHSSMLEEAIQNPPLSNTPVRASAKPLLRKVNLFLLKIKFYFVNWYGIILCHE